MKKPLAFQRYPQTNSKTKLQKFQEIAVFLAFGNLPNQNFLEGMNLGVCWPFLHQTMY